MGFDERLRAQGGLDEIRNAIECVQNMLRMEMPKGGEGVSPAFLRLDAELQKLYRKAAKIAALVEYEDPCGELPTVHLGAPHAGGSIRGTDEGETTKLEIVLDCSSSLGHCSCGSREQRGNDRRNGNDNEQEHFSILRDYF